MEDDRTLLEDSVLPEPTEVTKQHEQISAHDEDTLTHEREASVEEIVTPIEAGAQAQAEHEFETERKIPKECQCAIVSVNGKDVDQVNLPTHHRAA